MKYHFYDINYLLIKQKYVTLHTAFTIYVGTSLKNYCTRRNVPLWYDRIKSAYHSWCSRRSRFFFNILGTSFSETVPLRRTFFLLPSIFTCPFKPIFESRRLFLPLPEISFSSNLLSSRHSRAVWLSFTEPAQFASLALVWSNLTFFLLRKCFSIAFVFV